MSMFVYVGLVGGQCNVYVDIFTVYISKEYFIATNLILLLNLMRFYLMNLPLMYKENFAEKV